MMFFKIGLLGGLLALLMQVFVVLSPLFLNHDDARVCIHIQRFSQNYQQYLHSHANKITDSHTTHQHNPQHHLVQHNHQHTLKTQIDEKNIHLQHCDFCAIHSEFDVPQPLHYPVAHWFNVGYIIDFFVDYQQPFISLRLFEFPLKHAPPLF